MSQEEFAVLVPSYTAVTCLPRLSRAPVWQLRNGKSEVLQRQHSSWGQRGTKFLARDCKADARPTPCTQKQHRHFSYSRRAASLCSSSSAAGAWGFWSQGSRSLSPALSLAIGTSSCPLLQWQRVCAELLWKHSPGGCHPPRHPRTPHCTDYTRAGFTATREKRGGLKITHNNKAQRLGLASIQVLLTTTLNRKNHKTHKRKQPLSHWI